MNKRRVPATVLAVALSGLAIGLTACGSSKSGDSGSGSHASGAGAMSAYATCMSQNGVTMNIPSGGARPEWSGASHDPNHRPSFQPGQEPSGRVRPSGMRRSGAPGGFPGGGMYGSVDPTVLQKAQGVCSSLMPSRGPGRQGQGSGGPGQDGQGGPGGQGAPDGQGGPGGQGAPGGQADNGANAAYANCLKEHGVNDTSDLSSLNTADATIAKAVQTCAALKAN